MRKLLTLIPFLFLGCQPEPPNINTEHRAALEVAPIGAIPEYEGGRVLHPWHFRALAKDRFPAVATGNATDSQCFLADS